MRCEALGSLRNPVTRKIVIERGTYRPIAPSPAFMVHAVDVPVYAADRRDHGLVRRPAPARPDSAFRLSDYHRSRTAVPVFWNGSTGPHDNRGAAATGRAPTTVRVGSLALG